MNKTKYELASVTDRRRFLEEKYPKWIERTIGEHFELLCEEYSGFPLLMMPEQVNTYAEIWHRSEVLAGSLIGLGVEKGDHLAVLMENDPDFMALWIAASLVGAVMVPLNTQLRENELEYMIRQSDARWLILHQKAKREDHAITIDRIMQNKAVKLKLKKAVCIPVGEEKIPGSFLHWDTFLSLSGDVPGEVLAARRQDTGDPRAVAAIIYTSGSTGLPKGVMLTHDMMLRSGFATCLSRAYEERRRIFAPLPMYHVYFLQEGLLAVSFVGGAMISSRGFSPLESIRLMEKYGANDFLAVPSMLVSVLKQKELPEYDLEALKSLLCCAAPSPVPLWKRAVEMLDLEEIGTGCGGTEASSTTMLTEIGDSLEIVSTRVGEIKLAGVAGAEGFDGKSVEYKVIDPDTGEDLPEGSEGELAVRGNVVTHGYYNKPDETAFAIDEDGWLRSGDLGRIDENGYIQLLGRSKDVYKVSGETVAPKEIEDIISTHPAVLQAYVVGVPDRLTTETGAAFIELKRGMTATAGEIRAWCKGELARFKIPRYYWFVDASEWPLTATGKIQKFKLRDLAEERLEKKPVSENE